MFLLNPIKMNVLLEPGCKLVKISYLPKWQVNNCFLPAKWKIYPSEFFLSKSKSNCWIYRWIGVRFCRWEIVECDLFCLKLYTRQSGMKLSRTVYVASYLPQFFYPSKWRVDYFFYPSDFESTRDLSGRRVLIYTLFINSNK